MTKVKRRNTKNKKSILECFAKQHTITIKELSNLLPNIELSVIYRNIERFVDDGVLREIFVSQNIVAYELADDIHDHFICDNCHLITPLHLQTKLIKNMLPNNSVLNSGGIVVHGICGKCAVN